MNNFKRLEDEELRSLPGDTQRSVYNRIDNMRTVGQVFELYITKVLDLFVMMAGGKIEDRSKSRKTPDKGYPTDPEGEAPSGGPSVG